MIKVERRDGYDAIMIFSEDSQVAKLYVRDKGLISNLYVRKGHRGDLDLLREILQHLEDNYQGRTLYGYASPKGEHEDDDRRRALIRLYRMGGFKNVSGNKISRKF